MPQLFKKRWTFLTSFLTGQRLVQHPDALLRPQYEYLLHRDLESIKLQASAFTPAALLHLHLILPATASFAYVLHNAARPGSCWVHIIGRDVYHY